MKCRGCGEAVDEKNHAHGRQYLAGGPGAMHVDCEFKRLRELLAEARSMEKTADAEIERLREALGLLTTLHPAMEMDVDDPVGMAEKIERHVTERIKELEHEG